MAAAKKSARGKGKGGKGGAKGLTPMMQQYQTMRRSLPVDVLLFFRLGDFYELFFDDAKEAAGLLNVALTKRNNVPMCGVPHHAAEGYIGKLIKAGKRVAIGEQTGEAKPGTLVEREIRQVISAGTIDNLNLLEAARPNYLAAVSHDGDRWGLAYLDHTTGEFRVTETDNREALRDELARIGASELLVPDDQHEAFGDLPGALAYDGFAFLEDQARFLLEEHFRVQSLDGFGCAGLGPAVGAAGGILHYLQTQLRRGVDHIRRLVAFRTEAHVLIDAASQEHLDLVRSRSGNEHTLLAALDRTATPMGGRMLRHWLLHPLRDLAELTRRQDLIAALLAEPFILSQVQASLGEVRDIERTAGRLSQGSGNARDLKALSSSLARVPALRAHVEALGEGLEAASTLAARLRDFGELVGILEGALAEEPPATLKEGGIFRDGYSEAIDELRGAASEGKQWIAKWQSEEAERTGIKSLKVKYNAVFGYFIEVTKANLEMVPDEYTRKQTTVNAERYITPELKEVENKILGADERLRSLEYESFLELRGKVLEDLEAIQATAAAMAEIDVLAGLAETAQLYDYCRPRLDESRRLWIRDGRHPVLDQNIAEEKFVPNDTELEPESQRLILITGPNMAGKSTYIRQVALITLMAQMGSYVPAAEATVGLVDRIFTRVGASDDLARGQSTFMVEMNETALIVNSASERSLVILDEIGRGTSTFDGLSIAWSVAEHLHDTIKARTLFATHYHELTTLAAQRPGVKNFNVAVREWNDQIIFLRKIVPGSADKSYGIQVARLAGLPHEIIDRAKEILGTLEAQGVSAGHSLGIGAGETGEGAGSAGKRGRKRGSTDKASGERTGEEPPQLSLFG